MYLPEPVAISLPLTSKILPTTCTSFGRENSTIASTRSASPGRTGVRRRTVSSPQKQNRLFFQVAAQVMASSSTVASTPPWTMPSKPTCSGQGTNSVLTSPLTGITRSRR
jgi:hypothetical protein